MIANATKQAAPTNGEWKKSLILAAKIPLVRAFDAVLSPVLRGDPVLKAPNVSRAA